MSGGPKPVVYLITCTETGKQYVGIAQSGAAYRFKRHCESARKGSQTYLHRAIHKYGKENFTVETLETADDWKHAQELEQYFISIYNCFNPLGYNMTKGGEGALGFSHRPDSKAAMSRGHTGKTISTETRARMSAVKKGITTAKTPEARANYAAAARRRMEENPEVFARFIAARPEPKPLTEAHKAKLSKAGKGRKQSPEAIAARLPALKAALQRPEVKEKLALRGVGRPVSEETRAKMRESCRKATLANTELRAKVAAANKARVWTAESRAKLGASHKGRRDSPETKAKRAAATALGWERRRARMASEPGE